MKSIVSLQNIKSHLRFISNKKLSSANINRIRKDKLIVTITLLLTFEYVFHADHDRFKKLNLSYLYHYM